MSPKESKLPKEWYEKAKKDMRRVSILLEDNDIEGAGFHLQQAAEKAIKGFCNDKAERASKQPIG